MTKEKALITGVTGQDGAYLSELLLSKDYEVHGIKRRASTFNTSRIDHLHEEPNQPDRRFYLHHGDLTDSMSLTHVLEKVQPDEVYNLGAQSHVAVSFEEPEYTANSDAIGPLRLLEGIRILGLEDHARFYQASNSELFGLVVESPQSESTTFHPRSPYGAAKLYAHWITVNYREAYGLFACNGVAFNHESPLRGETFVTRKITRGLARIKVGLQDCLYLGNLDARRDWGHAAESGVRRGRGCRARHAHLLERVRRRRDRCRRKHRRHDHPRRSPVSAPSGGRPPCWRRHEGARQAQVATADDFSRARDGDG